MPHFLTTIAWAVFSVFVVVFVVYAVAHTWLVRPFVSAFERPIGRKFFPCLDRIAPRPISDFEKAYWAMDRRTEEQRAEHDRVMGALIDQARMHGHINREELRALREALIATTLAGNLRGTVGEDGDGKGD